jgi:TolB-like protein/DNA-binding winged helix-turn-helix (wHTH) protein/Flp pilus assembly protein TadD
METPDKPGVYEFGEFRLDAARQMLYSVRTDAWTSLTPRVFDTLLFLVKHPGVVIGRAALMKAVWPDVIVEENNLDQSISALRQLLGERDGEHPYIVTVRGRGYRFVAPVKVIAPPQAGDGPRRTARPALWLAGVSVAAVIVLVLVSLAPRKDESTPVTANDPQTLAILPFRPMIAAERNESLEFGMVETLIAQLHTEQMVVRPLSSVRRYADPEQDPLQAGRALGVNSILEGHMQRDGTRLRVSVRLLDVGSGRQLWADRYDEDMTDIFSVQDAIATKVRAALVPGLAAETTAHVRPTSDADAYQFYAAGRFLRRRGDEDGLRRAIIQFEHAIERDPDFALAYVGLAECHSILGVFGILAPHDTFPRAIEAIDRALELAPDLAEAHASLGHVKVQYEHDWAGGEAALRHSIRLNPNFAPAQQFLGILFALSGQFEEGLEQLRIAQSLEPSSAIYSALVGLLLNYQRRYDEAVEHLSRTLEMAPDFPTAHAYIAMAYMRRGDFDKAWEHLGRMPSKAPGSAAYQGQLYAFSGRHDEARAEIGRLVELSSREYVAPYDIATIHAALGDVDQAFHWLELAFMDRSQLIGWVPWDPVFDGLRDDPRYPGIVARLSVGEQARGASMTGH